MQVLIKENIQKICSSEEVFDEFLVLMCLNYQLSLNQLITLFSQGYEKDLELMGYKRMQALSSVQNIDFDYKNSKDRYVVEAFGKSIFLYARKRKTQCFNTRNFSSLAQNAYRKKNYKEKAKSEINRIMDFIKFDMNIVFENKPGMTGFDTENRNEQLVFILDLDAPTTLDVLAEIYISLMQGDFKSLNTPTLVKYLWYGNEISKDGLYAAFSKMEPEDAYNVLSESFDAYQRLVFYFRAPYFTLNETILLNTLYDSESAEEMIKRIFEAYSLSHTFDMKINSLETDEAEILFRDIKEEKLLYCPSYRSCFKHR